MIYVASAQGSEYDQVLESIMVGPVPVGVSRFVLSAPAPNPESIPTADIVGLAVRTINKGSAA